MVDRFIHAAKFGDMSTLKDCLNQRVDVDSIVSGRTALSFAVGSDYLNAVEFLIMRGADVNLGNPAPLLLAVRKSTFPDAAKIAKLLLENKADLTVKNEKGETLFISLQRPTKLM